jgi:serine/threonine protein kinase
VRSTGTLKPTNIILQNTGRIKIAEFEIVRSGHTGIGRTEIVDTIDYTSSEQFQK